MIVKERKVSQMTNRRKHDYNNEVQQSSQILNTMWLLGVCNRGSTSGLLYSLSVLKEGYKRLKIG